MLASKVKYVIVLDADLQNDPAQETPLDDSAVVERLTAQAKAIMVVINAPHEQYARVGW